MISMRRALPLLLVLIICGQARADAQGDRFMDYKKPTDKELAAKLTPLQYDVT